MVGAKMLRTDEKGIIELVSDGKEIWEKSRWESGHFSMISESINDKLLLNHWMRINSWVIFCEFINYYTFNS